MPDHRAPPDARAGVSRAAGGGRLWNVFCRVIDNFGDVGVCWRLAADLAGRGHEVRLWVDVPDALAWMAPGGCAGVAVRRWPEEGDAAPDDLGAVVVEAFGCRPPARFVEAMAASPRPPVWINLEYLSAEDYVERSHGLPSPHLAGPGRGLTTWFFYPGFTPRTGGLLREPGLPEACAGFDATAWRRAHGLALAPGERLASLFCYDGAPVAALVRALAQGDGPWRLATAPGAATQRAARALAGDPEAAARVRQQPLPWLSQADYDRLLWAADLNFVRGEDSFVRAQWAGRPFVWQIYPQHDEAHAAKLAAFLARLSQGAGGALAPEAWAHWQRWHRCWNGIDAEPPGAAPLLPAWTAPILGAVGAAARAWRAQMQESPDLVTRLVNFVEGKR